MAILILLLSALEETCSTTANWPAPRLSLTRQETAA